MPDTQRLHRPEHVTDARGIIVANGDDSSDVVVDLAQALARVAARGRLGRLAWERGTAEHRGGQSECGNPAGPDGCVHGVLLIWRRAITTVTSPVSIRHRGAAASSNSRTSDRQSNYSAVPRPLNAVASTHTTTRSRQ